MGFTAKRSYSIYCSDIGNPQSLLSYPSPISIAPAPDPPPSNSSRPRSFRAESCRTNWTCRRKSGTTQADEQSHTCLRREESPFPLLRRAGSVPIPTPHAAEKNLERLFGVKNPKPDYAFGFSPSIFTKDEQSLLQRYDAFYTLSKGIISPFFIMEWKGPLGTMQDCSVQARRGGAAIVNARRQMHASTIPEYDYSTPDLATIAFSCSMTSEIAYIAVHWCQRVATNDCWYMAVVRRFFTAEDDDIQELWLSLHNIVDWGLLERRKSIREELKVLDDRWQLAKALELGGAKTSIGFQEKKKLIESM